MLVTERVRFGRQQDLKSDLLVEGKKVDHYGATWEMEFKITFTQKNVIGLFLRLGLT